MIETKLIKMIVYHTEWNMNLFIFKTFRYRFSFHSGSTSLRFRINSASDPDETSFLSGLLEILPPEKSEKESQ